ncbi:hypothetical protein A4S06_11330 [Erysipelotrichaceae bacterium MTC7]|nr:hypothetical protein A4S06_11330 [Erysipelotrichaceae bacterium MTC7]
MIYFTVKIHGLFSFRNFTADFTYARKAKNDELHQSLKNYPNVRYRKLNIVMGANSSGKSTLGKLLCMISNYVSGRDIQSVINIDLAKMCQENQPYFDDIYFETIYYHKDYMYQLHVSFDGEGVVSETWKRIKLAKKDTYNDAVAKLSKVGKENIETYSRSESGITFGFKSPELSKSVSKYNLLGQVSYLYSFQQFEVNRRVESSIPESKTLRDRLLKVFDPSIASIDPITSIVVDEDGIEEVVDLNMERIRFVNGRKQDVDFGKELTSENTTLSTGTIEAIHLAHVLHKIDRYSVVYLDETMVHSHHELEPYILQYIMKVLEKNEMQLFFTTHSTEALELDIPNYNVMFMRKSNSGYTEEIIKPVDSMKHNKRSLVNAFVNDQFSTSPDITELLDLIMEFDDD